MVIECKKKKNHTRTFSHTQAHSLTHTHTEREKDCAVVQPLKRSAVLSPEVLPQGLGDFVPVSGRVLGLQKVVEWLHSSERCHELRPPCRELWAPQSHRTRYHCEIVNMTVRPQKDQRRITHCTLRDRLENKTSMSQRQSTFRRTF